MEEFDTTTPEKTESESLEDMKFMFYHRTGHLRKLIRELERRIANLETQRTPADANMDDAEWY
jgi:hypothetical protein